MSHEQALFPLQHEERIILQFKYGIKSGCVTACILPHNEWKHFINSKRNIFDLVEVCDILIGHDGIL